MQGKALVVTDSDEHDEAGHMIEDARLRRLDDAQAPEEILTGLRNEIASPRFQTGTRRRVTLVGWGSTYGAIKEAASAPGE